MSRFPVNLCLILVSLSMSLANPSAANSSRERRLDVYMPTEEPTQRVYFYSASGNEKALITLFHSLIEKGAKHVNCFLPNTIVCELPGALSARSFLRDPSVTMMTDSQVDEMDSPERAFNPGWAKRCYAMVEEQAAARYDPHSTAGGGAYDAVGPLGDSILEVPEETVRRTDAEPSDSYPDPRNIAQNSELLLGSILVQQVLPESTPHPLNDENWSEQSEAAAIGDAVATTIYLQNTYEKVPLNFVFNKQTSVRTTMEPIKQPLKETVWIAEVMTALGYPDDGSPDRHLTAVHEFNNDKRREYGCDWVFTAFIVNAAKDPDHLFDDTRSIGWSYLGGPYLVVPYPAGDYLMGQAFKHYMATMFWALEEGPASIYGCNDFSGYLDYQNRNKTLGYDPFWNTPKSCPGIMMPDPCIMNSRDALEWYYAGDPCEYTAGQFGLVDKNPRNSVPDCLDAPPTVYFEPSEVETVFTQNTVIRFKVVSEGVP
ncbi:MAG: hypothetical protein P8181_11415, partial [bacterium]